MRQSQTTLPTRIPKPASPVCDVHEFKIAYPPQSNGPWKLYRVPADQIVSINSDWKHVLSTPGIHLAGKSYNNYRVAIDDSYIPWLSGSKLKFQRDLNPLSPEDVLVEWASSAFGLILYERIIKDIQDPQSKEQLVLTLAALLCFLRLYSPPPNTNHPMKRSIQADFNAILDGERLSNARSVSEYMVLSVLRVFYTVKDNEKMRTFLDLALNREWCVRDPFYDFPDQYWTCRIWSKKLGMKVGLDHTDGLRLAKKIVGPAKIGEGKTVIGQVEMVLMRQESGATNTHSMLTETQCEEASNSSLRLSNDAKSGRIQLDGYDFNSYTLVRVSNAGDWPRALDGLSGFDEILSIEKLEDGTWELPVYKPYLPTLKDKLWNMAPDCTIEQDYDPTKRADAFRARAERMKREAWPKAAAFYVDLVMGDASGMAMLDNDKKEMEEVETGEEQEGWEMVMENTNCDTRCAGGLPGWK